jgi:hypothetical protein
LSFAQKSGMDQYTQTRSSAEAVPFGRKLHEWRQQLGLLIKTRSPFSRSDFCWLPGIIAEYDRYTRAHTGKPILSCRVLEIGLASAHIGYSRYARSAPM